MDILKALWPTAFRVVPKDVSSFLVQLILLIVVCAAVGIVMGLLGRIPILGLIFRIVGSLIELYAVVGIVLCSLVYAGVLK